MRYTPKKTALKIEGCTGGYIRGVAPPPVKKNQRGLYKEIEKKNEEEKPLNMSYWKQRGHGRSIQCKIGVEQHPAVWKAEEKMQKNWAGLSQYIAVTRKGYCDNKWFKKTTFYITLQIYLPIV